MTQTAMVRRILPQNRVELSIMRESACGHDCSSCGGCSMSEKREVTVIANDPIGAHPGDSVIVESSSKRLLGIAALVLSAADSSLFLPVFSVRFPWIW